MKRLVEPELLDELPPDDPRAIHSRHDLRRLNRLMRHTDIFCAAFAGMTRPPRHIAELGAGDGSMMLNIAQKMHQHWTNVRVTLVDRQKTVPDETLAKLSAFGWQAEAVTADVFDWLESAPRTDAILANLFLHHFADDKLAAMLRLIAAHTDFFVACETRRTPPAFMAGRLLWLIGCNAVTRNDAQISMRAGFCDRELSSLWPKDGNWRLEERGAILFTHLLIADKSK